MGGLRRSRRRGPQVFLDPAVDHLGFGLIAESADSDGDLGGLLRLGFEMDDDTFVGGIPRYDGRRQSVFLGLAFEDRQFELPRRLPGGGIDHIQPIGFLDFEIASHVGDRAGRTGPGRYHKAPGRVHHQPCQDQ